MTPDAGVLGPAPRASRGGVGATPSLIPSSASPRSASGAPPFGFLTVPVTAVVMISRLVVPRELHDPAPGAPDWSGAPLPIIGMLSAVHAIKAVARAGAGGVGPARSCSCARGVAGAPPDGGQHGVVVCDRGEIRLPDARYRRSRSTMPGVASPSPFASGTVALGCSQGPHGRSSPKRSAAALGIGTLGSGAERLPTCWFTRSGPTLLVGLSA